MHTTTENFIKADLIVIDHEDGSVKFVTLPEKLRKATMVEIGKYLSGELKFPMEHMSWMHNKNRIFRVSNYDENMY